MNDLQSRSVNFFSKKFLICSTDSRVNNSAYRLSVKCYLVATAVTRHLTKDTFLEAKRVSSKRSHVHLFLHAFDDTLKTQIFTCTHTHTLRSSSLYSFHTFLPGSALCLHSPSHAGACNSLQWLTASMWSLWCGELDFLTCGISAAFIVIWQDTESPLLMSKVAWVGVTSVCALVHVCL